MCGDVCESVCDSNGHFWALYSLKKVYLSLSFFAECLKCQEM